jgi:hypothetical protein
MNSGWHQPENLYDTGEKLQGVGGPTNPEKENAVTVLILVRKVPVTIDELGDRAAPEYQPN